MKNITSLSTAELVALGTQDAINELNRRNANRIAAGKKPRGNVLRAIAGLTGLAAPAPKVAAAATFTAAPKAAKTVQDYVTIGEAKGVKWLENMATHAKGQKPVIEAAIKFLGSKPAPKAAAKAAAPVAKTLTAMDIVAQYNNGLISVNEMAAKIAAL